MHFLVIAEDTPYYQWQVELLIESFKIKNLEDNLFLYLIKTENSVDAIKVNINQHKNLTYFDSEKLRNGSLNFDFHKCILDYRKNNPYEDFMILDADVLLSDLKEQEYKSLNLTYQIEQKESPDLDLIFNFAKSKYNYSFFYISSVIYFNSLYSYDFFNSSFPVIEDLVKIAFFCNIDDLNHEPNIDLYKYAYLIVSLMYNIKINPSYKILNYAYEGIETNVDFVSYKHDIKPYFYKKNYYQNNFKNMSLNYADPFENILDLPDFIGCSFIKKIVKSYQNFSA